MENLSTKENILYSALQLFLVNGFNGVSINNIIQKANVSKGALYHYFKNKDDLFITIINTFFFQEIDNFEKILENEKKDFDKQLFLIFRGSIDMYHLIEEQTQFSSSAQKYNGYYKLFFDSISLFPELHEKFQYFYTNFEIQIIKILNQAKKNEKIKKDINMKTIAFQIIAGIEGTMIMKTLDLNIDLEEKIMELYKSINLLLKKDCD